MMNEWIDIAVLLLKNSLKPVPQELNELDWKTNLSDKSTRLAQHISAFANCKGGGFLVFGINNEVIETALRRKVKMYPEVAIREFVANAPN